MPRRSCSAPAGPQFDAFATARSARYPPPPRPSPHWQTLSPRHTASASPASSSRLHSNGPPHEPDSFSTPRAPPPPPSPHPRPPDSPTIAPPDPPAAAPRHTWHHTTTYPAKLSQQSIAVPAYVIHLFSAPGTPRGVGRGLRQVPFHVTRFSTRAERCPHSSTSHYRPPQSLLCIPWYLRAFVVTKSSCYAPPE